MRWPWSKPKPIDGRDGRDGMIVRRTLPDGSVVVTYEGSDGGEGGRYGGAGGRGGDGAMGGRGGEGGRGQR